MGRVGGEDPFPLPEGPSLGLPKNPELDRCRVHGGQSHGLPPGRDQGIWVFTIEVDISERAKVICGKRFLGVLAFKEKPEQNVSIGITGERKK